MSATRLSGLVAIVLLCGIVTAGAATRAPGSIEPAAAAPSSQETAKPAESAQAAKPRARPTRAPPAAAATADSTCCRRRSIGSSRATAATGPVP